MFCIKPLFHESTKVKSQSTALALHELEIDISLKVLMTDFHDVFLHASERANGVSLYEIKLGTPAR